jgi:putative ABC transport system permease protein
MPEWAAEIHARLSSLSMAPVREAEIVEELSQHLEDRWREAVAAGADPEETTAAMLAELGDIAPGRVHLLRALAGRARPESEPAAPAVHGGCVDGNRRGLRAGAGVARLAG